MKDQLISFETAKLAWKKGFNISVEKSYSANQDLLYKVHNRTVDNNLTWNSDYLKNNWNTDDIYLAPTQSLLQKWLREVHRIEFISKPFIETTKDGIIYKYVADCIDIRTATVKKSYKCDTYEEALEEGLQNALNLINN